MSKIKMQSPVVHTPAFNEYSISGNDMKSKILSAGLQLPMGMMDSTYYYTDLEGWMKLLEHLMLKSSLYKAEKFDCDDYAMKAAVTCRELYGLNTLAFVLGNMPLGYHGFNMLYTGQELLLFEPNAGFDCSGQAFPIGEFGYAPSLVLV